MNVIPVIPCHNEEDRLEATLRHLLSGSKLHDIVVVDDMSEDNCVRRCMRAHEWDRLGKHGYVTIKRGAHIHFIKNGRHGVGECRQIGGDKAFELGATTAFFLDAHVAINPYDVLGLSEIGEERQAIVQPRCLGWPVSKTACRYGGNLGWHPRRILGVGYIKRKPPPEDPRWETPTLLKTKGLIGANGYTIPKDVWERIGGWSRECGLWGFNEQLLTSKAFFGDVPLYCDTTRTSRHYFKSSKKGEGLAISTTGYWYGRWAVLRMLFCEETFKKVWFPLLEKRFCNTTLWTAVNQPKLLAERDKYLPLRIRSEKEWFEEFLPHHKEVWEGKL